MRKESIRIIATFFYMGYCPIASGSLASLAGVLLYMAVSLSLPLYLFFLTLVTVLGFWAAGKMEEVAGTKDPSCVVIDEVCGMMIACFMLPLSWPVMMTAYFLFRAFDMFKIYPAYKLEPLPGSVGIMMDDVVAGIYTNLIMHIALNLRG